MASGYQDMWEYNLKFLSLRKARLLSLFLVLLIVTGVKGQSYFPNLITRTSKTPVCFVNTTTGRQVSAEQIKSGELIAREISGGLLNTYEIELINNKYARATIDKGDLSILVTIYEPGGSKAGEFVSKKYGPLHIHFISDKAGAHRLEIRSLEKNSIKRKYELRVEPPRDATPQDRQYCLATKAFAEAEILRASWQKDSLRAAIKKYAEARLIWQDAGYLNEAADAYQSTGETYFTLCEYALALGSYKNALSISQDINDHRREMSALNCMAYAFLALSNNQTSIEYSKKVLGYWERLQPPYQSKEDRRIQAQALNNIGEVYYLIPDIKSALDYFQRALVLWTATGDRRGQALSHLNIGYALTDSGNLQEALEHCKQSLLLWNEIDDPQGTALSSTALGGIYSFLGEKQSALDSHEQALRLLHTIGDQQGEAAALNGIGKAYEDLNDLQRALGSYNEALKLYQNIHNREFEALTKYYIGRVYRTMGDTIQALTFYNTSLSLSREVPNLRIQAYSLKDIASITCSEGKPLRALEQYKETLELYKSIGDRRGQAYTLNSIGEILHTTGDTQEAINNYRKALDLSKAVEDRSEEILVSYNIARAERDRGNIGEALSFIKDSVEKIESIRSKVASQYSRISYFASAHRYYDLYITVLLEMHRRFPEKGFDAASIEASERYHARSLTEMLKEAKIDIRRDVDPRLLERERSLQHLLSAKADRQTRLLIGKYTEEQAQELKKEIDALSNDYQNLEGEIRAKSSRYAALTQPQPLPLDKIRQELLDDDTLLLEYFLGDERSFLWAVTRNAIIAYELPKRKEVESAAREFYQLLTVRNEIAKEPTAETRQERLARATAEYPKATAKLSQMLLGPVAHLLKRKRLLIVADGALQYVAFAALSVQREQGKGASQPIPLVVNHEIISLPSASTLAVMRKEISERRPAPNFLAVLADPVFQENDVRVKTHSEGSVSNRQMPASTINRRGEPAIDTKLDGEQDGWPRLLFTRLEAKEITGIAMGKRIKSALGFEASKDFAIGPEISSFQIVHFATHGIIDSIHPELSGIILSLVNEKGAAVDGFLRLHEIYNLKLSAGLVVLSGCQTGLGKEIRGEGLIGLTRGFMYAGTPRVVASLWSVRDEATAELMKRFYTAILKKGKTPSAALQAAQASMWRDSDWSSAYYWAGFIIQGEWR
jgi:CHAT domain-containing protein/predicted negative regulator of RcsB-dependent stress response